MLLVSKEFEKIMYDELYKYIENFLNQLLCRLLKCTAKSKTRKPRKIFILKIKQHHFVLDHFILFLDLEFHILPKIEVKENFPRFPTFQF